MSSSPSPADRYGNRRHNGIYSDLLKTIDECPSTLEGDDYNEDFVRRITDKGHYKYVLPSDEAENDSHFLLFGQICHSALGTQLSSRGNKMNYNVRNIPHNAS